MRNLSSQAIADIEAAEARVQRFLRNFNSFLHSSLGGILKGLYNKDVTAKEAVYTLNQLRTELQRAGLGEKLAEVEEIYAKELKAIVKQFSTLGFKNAFTAADAQFAETLVTYDVSAIKSQVFTSVDQLKSAVMRQVLAGQQPDIPQMAADEIDSLDSKVETELRTAVSGFNQAVTNAKAKELGIGLWVYLGPEDDLTRDFCQDLLDRGPVFTEAEIEAMPDQQGLPVSVYGGGYNCRHQWRPITEELAASEYGYAQEG